MNAQISVQYAYMNNRADRTLKFRNIRLLHISGPTQAVSGQTLHSLEIGLPHKADPTKQEDKISLAPQQRGDEREREDEKEI